MSTWSQDFQTMDRIEAAQYAKNKMLELGVITSQAYFLELICEYEIDEDEFVQLTAAQIQEWCERFNNVLRGRIAHANGVLAMGPDL